MRIDIKKSDMKKAVIITFRTHSEKFKSPYERSKFFRELHGWKQIVPREGKKYSYKREGLLDEIPHMKIADSVFIAAAEHMKKIKEFFNQWEEKVDFETMKIMCKKKQLMEMF